MIHCKGLNIQLCSLALLIGLQIGPALAALPQGEFACQVKISDDSHGLVLVQADAKVDAIAVSKNSRHVLSVDGSLKDVSVLRVVECVNRREERFNDSNFQSYFEKVPL